MKAISVFLIVMLVLVGIAAVALPLLVPGTSPTQPPASQISTSDEVAQPVQVACYPPPCDCTGGAASLHRALSRETTPSVSRLFSCKCNHKSSAE